MDWKSHREEALRLARILKLDPRLVLMGDMIPDIDLIPLLKHRETLHNPLVTAFLMLVNPSLGVGHAKHCSDDYISPIYRVVRYMEGVLRGKRPS